MANGHGGYRKPANPAPVSGPGKYSKRTDGGPAQVMSSVPDQPYGQQKADMDSQRTAPMAGQSPTPAGPAGSAEAMQQMAHSMAFQGPGIGDPSQRPDEPITAGASFGDGPGPEVLSQVGGPAQTVAPPTGAMTALFQRYSATDTSGILGQLYLAARNKGV